MNVHERGGGGQFADELGRLRKTTQTFHWDVLLPSLRGRSDTICDQHCVSDDPDILVCVQKLCHLLAVQHQPP
eukprot:3935002-Rhodomonas_salina.2